MEFIPCVCVCKGDSLTHGKAVGRGKDPIVFENSSFLPERSLNLFWFTSSVMLNLEVHINLIIRQFHFEYYYNQKILFYLCQWSILTLRVTVRRSESIFTGQSHPLPGMNVHAGWHVLHIIVHILPLINC